MAQDGKRDPRDFVDSLGRVSWRQRQQEAQREAAADNPGLVRTIYMVAYARVKSVMDFFNDKRQAAVDRADTQMRRAFFDSVHVGDKADDGTRTVTFVDAYGPCQVPVHADAKGGGRLQVLSAAYADASQESVSLIAKAQASGLTDDERRTLRNDMRLAVALAGGDADAMRSDMVTMALACQQHGAPGFTSDPPKTADDFAREIGDVLSGSGVLDRHTTLGAFHATAEQRGLEVGRHTVQSTHERTAADEAGHVDRDKAEAERGRAEGRAQEATQGQPKAEREHATVGETQTGQAEAKQAEAEPQQPAPAPQGARHVMGDGIDVQYADDGSISGSFSIGDPNEFFDVPHGAGFDKDDSQYADDGEPAGIAAMSLDDLGVDVTMAPDAQREDGVQKPSGADSGPDTASDGLGDADDAETGLDDVERPQLVSSGGRGPVDENDVERPHLVSSGSRRLADADGIETPGGEAADELEA